MPQHGPSGDPHNLGSTGNATGRSGALGLLSEKLAKGLANKKKKLLAGNQTQSLSQQAISPMKQQGPQFPSTV